MREISITSIEGLLVGHAENAQAKTGCTVILAPNGAAASCHNPGFAPGSRETDALKPANSIDTLHGLCLSGGSAFGLAAASGVAKFLREKGLGVKTSHLTVPLVAAAVIYDYPNNLSQGTLPDEAMGYLAATQACRTPVISGPFGAGLSASSGKLGDPSLSSPSGLGSMGYQIDALQIAALVVANPLGSLIDPENGAIISGFKTPQGRLATREEILQALAGLPPLAQTPPTNTVLVAVATNAALSKLDLHRLAIMASTGVARAVYPANTPFDGDSVFTLSTGTGPTVNLPWLGALAAEAVAQALVNSVSA